MIKDDILKLASENNGYIYSELIKQNNIKTIYISRLVLEGKLKKVARGIYITKDGIEDDLFILSLQYKKMVYCGETALFLNQLSNKQFPTYEALFPYGYNNKVDRVKMRYTRKESYSIGIDNIKTMFGNLVKSYDKERCICDLFINPDKYDYEDRVYAINEYKNNYLNFDKLYSYAKQLGVYDEVKNVFEVIGWN